MTVKLFKLISGEELIADWMMRVESSPTDNFEIKDAVSLVYNQEDAGRVSVGFAPFMNYAVGPVTLSRSAVAAMADVKDQLRSEYDRVFSRITIAPAGSILR